MYNTNNASPNLFSDLFLAIVFALPLHRSTTPTHTASSAYLYGESALIVAANSGSHLQPHSISIWVAWIQGIGGLTCHHWTITSPCCKEAPLESQWHTLHLVTRQWRLQGKTPGKDHSSYRNTIGQPSTDIRFRSFVYSHALCHVNIVTRGPPATVLTLLGFNGNSQCRADGFAELACNASLFTGGVSP